MRWGIKDTSDAATYRLMGHGVPEWLFYAVVAIWPPLRRSVVEVRRIKFAPDAVDVIAWNLRDER